jgi:hypothetical protein
MGFRVGNWRYSFDHDEPCRVIAVDSLWGEEIP